MSNGYFFGGSGGAATNPNVTYEARGFGSDGSGTTVTCHASAHTKGSASASLGVTTADWTGFILYVALTSSANVRFMLDMSVDGGGSWTKVSNFFIVLGSTTQSASIKFPLNIASGSDIMFRAQGSTGSTTLKVAVTGIIGGAPGFTTFSSVGTLDAGNTRPSGTNVPFDDDGSSGWTAITASAAATYGALLAVIDGNGTAFGSAQACTVMLGTGASTFEVEFTRFLAQSNTGSGFNRTFSHLIEQTIASTTRVAVQVRAATPGTDNARVALYGFS